MKRSNFMAGAAVLALLVAAPSAGFAQAANARVGGGGAPAAAAPVGGGGGGAHFSGGGMRGGGANFAGGGMRAGSGVPNFAARAAAPNVGGGTWAGGRTAWNGGNWRGGAWRGHRGWGPGAVAGAAIVGGAIAANSYAYYGGPDYYYDSPDYYTDNTYYNAGPEVAVVQGGGDPSYCAQRYRSYDPASGTYLGYDGQRHPCP